MKLFEKLSSSFSHLVAIYEQIKHFNFRLSLQFNGTAIEILQYVMV